MLRGRLIALAGCVMAAVGVLAAPASGAGGWDATVVANAVAGAREAAAAANPQNQVTDPVPLLELISAGGRGRLYTLDEYEARAAVSQYGMRLEYGRVGYLRRQAFTGSTPLYRLKPRPDATRWLFTASASERSSLLGQGWVDEGVAGHISTASGPGLVRLMRFSNSYEWRLAPESRTQELLDAGYRLDGPVGYMHAEYTRVGAVYFGMFHTGGHATIIRRTKEVYGRDNDWWGGVRDFRDGTHWAEDNWPGTDWSYLQPSIGYYDDSQPATLEKHIAQATSSGLDFFNFYWYWDATTHREKVTGPSLDAFLAARNRSSIDFTVAVCAHPFDGLRIPRSEYPTVAQLLVDKYLSQPNTLRTNDGRKILTICDARGLGGGTEPNNAYIKEFIQEVRTRAQAKFGEDVYVMINQAGFDTRQVYDAGANGGYCTTDGPGILTRLYERYLAGQRAYYNQAPSIPYGRCVLSDFDERPRYPIENTDASAIRWFSDHTIDGYREAVRNVRTDILKSRRPPEIDNFVFVYAWNEWHEGGVIEPNVRDGCAYLNVLRIELRLTGGSGCVASP
jgi:Glycosyltransferase WbsX/Repeat of unknown function (DUF5648)